MRTHLIYSMTSVFSMLASPLGLSRNFANLSPSHKLYTSVGVRPSTLIPISPSSPSPQLCKSDLANHSPPLRSSYIWLEYTYVPQAYNPKALDTFMIDYDNGPRSQYPNMYVEALLEEEFCSELA